jgi:hypothetical protein
VTSGPFDAIDRLRHRLIEHGDRDRVRILDPGQSLQVEMPDEGAGPA